VEEVRDHGQMQELRFSGDTQKLLHDLLARTEVHHFEQARPSLHDIFVRIARPQPDEEETSP
jgi:ABC-2 type transport system ATP-binding protein